MRKLLRTGRRLTNTGRPIVLMYPRVAKLTADPWRLAVTPDHFARQIEILKRERDIVPMVRLTKEMREGRLSRNTAAVTFDDGYADVFHNAVPVLVHHSCPATVFVTSQPIVDQRGFWWDILCRILMETAILPEHLSIAIAGERLEWHLGDGGSQTLTGESRDALHVALHAMLKPMDPLRRQAFLECLAAWAGTEAGSRLSDRAMTADELRQLATIKGIEIGAHTLTHPSLPLISLEEAVREVAESRRQCEVMSGQPVTGFAYPFGDHDDASVQAVNASGLHYAVTTVQREIGPRTDPFRIPRILVADWDEADFQRMVLSHG